MIRVVIAEDHHLVREGIRALLEKADDIEVVGEAVNGREAVELVKRLGPDVLVMDIAMPRLNGVAAVEEISTLGSRTQVVILSMHSDEILARQSLRYGARGYLLKDSVTEELLLAIRAANRSATYLSPAISETVLGDLITSQASPEMLSPLNQLTTREYEVLQLISEGYTNKTIAEMMSISVKTVERHRTNLMSKLRVTNIVELIRLAIKHGLIHLDE